MHAEIVYVPGNTKPLIDRKPWDKTELLCREIAETAQRLGIYNGEVALDGPTVLLLLKDIEELANSKKG